MSDLIERLNDAWRKLYGDGDEHDVCDTIAEAAAALEAAREDAARWRAVREMDGGEIYAVLGDCDGMHSELADAAIDQARGKGVKDEA